MARISVIGLGKLGVPMAAIFASKGHSVIGVDLDIKRVQAIRSRIDPVGETGVGQLLRGSCNGRAKIMLEATQDAIQAVRSTDFTFVVVGTPSIPSGRFSLKYVLESLTAIGHALKDKKSFHIVAITSTVCPGDMVGEITLALENASGKKVGKDFGLCYNPEFIALGTVIQNFLNPDFVLIGESDPVSGRVLSELYEQVCDNKPRIARMNLTNAEVTKLALNTFVTTKISYANMLARICEKLPGADVDVVTQTLGLDSRIGGKYLKGGSAFGGPCFPRDNLALMEVARALNVPADIPAATHAVNCSHSLRLYEIVQSVTKKAGRIGVLGLAYKPETGVVESSAGFDLARALVGGGYEVKVFDPHFNDGVIGAQKHITATNCVLGSDVVVVTIPCKEFLAVEEKSWHNKTVVDCWRLLRGKVPSSARYVGIGLGV
jgi:UDPglucose 6-dehydrogenase